MATYQQRLAQLFQGFEGAYGTYDHTATSKSLSKGGKIEIKSTAKTLRSQVTFALWEAHVAGHNSLGIIPIREDGTCFWGCIDVDKYDGSHAEILKQINRFKFPLVACRTKSGGAHLFLFVEKPVSALNMQTKLREMAAKLGVGNSEIFPKQTTILADRGDLGNWLNMPYFGGDKTDRYCWKESMAGMTLGEFLNYAESRKINDFDAMPESKQESDGLEDGPPCLQHLATVGFPEGTRNNGLFALGIFCKKKYGERWEEMLEQYNREFMDPPLDSEEVQNLVRNLEKKDYNYRCSDQPCVAYCNSTLCRTRKYGVGGSDEYPMLTGMSYLDTDPKLWFVDVDGHRVELTSDQLQNYRSFHRAAMEKIQVCYMTMKQDTWFQMVNSVMRDAIKIEVPDNVSIRGVFMEYLEDFCFARHRATDKDELLSGKPWQDEEERRVYFRLRDLMSFLKRSGFESWSQTQVVSELRKIGDNIFFNIRNKGCNAWWVRVDAFGKADPAPLPESVKEPI